MEYLRLSIGLLLPWLGGYLALSVVEKRFNVQNTHKAKQLGYGFFIGYAGLQGLVLTQSRMFGTVSFWPIVGGIAVIVAIGAILLFRSRHRLTQPNFNATQISNPVTTALFWLFLVWALLHLLFVAIEILHRPVFPWDAWVNWIYRAKAWFYQGQILAMDHPTDWLQGYGEALYSVAGNHYPTFSPIMALWAATALGYWSETLINLPVMLCGLAMALAMYGQCREFGLEKWLAALSAYLLLSVPLMGTHLALAGQADIWMAGFTGFGFVALLHGAIRDNRYQILLGLGMIAMGIATKLEGTVWSAAALMILALSLYLRATLILVALALLAGITGWLLGITYLDLPLLGGLGLTDGRIHIPLMGSYGLTSFDLWDDYQDNFFEGGSWHLLWTFILISTCSLWFLPTGKLRRTVTVFFSVLLAAQLFIFKNTESGQWAEDWTAINRLPLHFTPPLIFIIAILASALLDRDKAHKLSGRMIFAPALGLAVTVAATVTYLLMTYPASDARGHTFTAQNLSIVVGGGRVAGDIGLIEQYDNNIAILSSGSIQMDTRELGLLEVETQGPNQKPGKFFWRNGSNPENLHSINIEGRGHHILNLDELPQWQGQVNELGLIFYTDGGKSAEFHSLEITPHSLTAQLRKLGSDWSAPSLWSQSSANWTPAGAVASSVPLPIFMGGWVLITALITLVSSRHTPGAFTSALLCALLAWVALDLRWSVNSLVQASDTLQSYPLASAKYLDFGDDQTTRHVVETARAEMERPNRRTVIIGEDETMRFQILRAKYHALPAAAYVHEGTAKATPVEVGSTLLLLKRRYNDTGHQPVKATAIANALSKRSGLQATTLWDTADGFLLEISDAASADTKE